MAHASKQQEPKTPSTSAQVSFFILIGFDNLASNRSHTFSIDKARNLYIGEYYSATIRKVSPSGPDWVVTTIAGSTNRVLGNLDLSTPTDASSVRLPNPAPLPPGQPENRQRCQLQHRRENNHRHYDADSQHKPERHPGLLPRRHPSPTIPAHRAAGGNTRICPNIAFGWSEHTKLNSPSS